LPRVGGDHWAKMVARSVVRTAAPRTRRAPRSSRPRVTDAALDEERAADFAAVCHALGRAVRSRVRNELEHTNRRLHPLPRLRFRARLAHTVDNCANVDPRGCKATLNACSRLAHRRSLRSTPPVSTRLARCGKWLQAMALHVSFLHPEVEPCIDRARGAV